MIDRKTNKYASCPDWRISPHADRRYPPFVTLTFNLWRSSIVTVAVLDIFRVKAYDLDFWPLKVIQGQMWRCQSIALCPATKCYRWSNLISVTVFEIFRVKILTFHLLTLIRLTPEPKVTKMGDDVLSTYVYHPTKFQHDRANGLRDMRYQSFSRFGPWGG